MQNSFFGSCSFLCSSLLYLPCPQSLYLGYGSGKKRIPSRFHLQRAVQCEYWGSWQQQTLQWTFFLFWRVLFSLPQYRKQKDVPDSTFIQSSYSSVILLGIIITVWNLVAFIVRNFLFPVMLLSRLAYLYFYFIWQLSLSIGDYQNAAELVAFIVWNFFFPLSFATKTRLPLLLFCLPTTDSFCWELSKTCWIKWLLMRQTFIDFYFATKTHLPLFLFHLPTICVFSLYFINTLWNSMDFNAWNTLVFCFATKIKRLFFSISQPFFF